MSSITRQRIAARLGFTYLKNDQYFKVMTSLRDKRPVTCLLTLREASYDVTRLYWTISLDNGFVLAASSSRATTALEHHLNACLVLYEAAQLRKDPTTHDDFG